MENISIFDDFLNDDELKILLNIIDNKLWGYGHSSGGNIELVNTKFFKTDNLDYFFLDVIKPKLDELYLKIFPLKKGFLYLKRSYMHIQTFGQDGAYHIDGFKNNDEKIYTFCLYITSLNDEDLEKYGGDFLIKLPNSKSIISIITKMNRCILFPSEYVHKGNAYDRFISDKRLCLTWKVEESIKI